MSKILVNVMLTFIFIKLSVIKAIGLFQVGCVHAFLNFEKTSSKVFSYVSFYYMAPFYLWAFFGGTFLSLSLFWWCLLNLAPFKNAPFLPAPKKLAPFDPPIQKKTQTNPLEYKGNTSGERVTQGRNS